MSGNGKLCQYKLCPQCTIIAGSSHPRFYERVSEYVFVFPKNSPFLCVMRWPLFHRSSTRSQFHACERSVCGITDAYDIEEVDGHWMPFRLFGLTHQIVIWGLVEWPSFLAHSKIYISLNVLNEFIRVSWAFCVYAVGTATAYKILAGVHTCGMV